MTHERPRCELTNGVAVPLERIPRLTPDEVRHRVLQAVSEGQRVVTCFVREISAAAGHELLVVLADDANGCLTAIRSRVNPSGFPSLTPDCPQLHLFEREIAETSGITPLGHPWLKPVRYPPARPGGPATPAPGTGDFFRVEGDEVHEVAVGPVHAGVIEPGHFRFQMLGEEVLHLEIALGYQHRGIERALGEGLTPRSLHLAETLAGDSTIAHGTAWCQALEALAGLEVPPRAQVLRGLALELERLANHVGDLGALAGDVGFLPTASWCGRLRGDFLNMTALLCGNRFGRGLLRPGGVEMDADTARLAELLDRLVPVEKDTRGAIELLWDTPSAMARFEDTGIVDTELARELGLVGPAARASGLARDIRQDHPAGNWRFVHIPIATVATGDVLARGQVRWLEIQRSLEFIREQAALVPQGPVCAGEWNPVRPPASAADALVVVLVEGWRGEVCHTALTDSSGRICHWKVVDPSFHNWTGLALALRGQQVSDFPLCNKSFNLFYCGHDL